MHGFPPGVFIVGSQKCGTTSLARLLEKNPDICLSEPKEPNYYSVNYDKGVEWYREKFKYPDKVLVDASTTYTMCPLSDAALNLKQGRSRQTGVPERIWKDSPDAKIIYIIREPVGRLYSNYWHNVKYGYEKRSLDKAIKHDPQYLHLSQYYAQIAKYLDFFARENILILKFECFITNQQAILNSCERFLSVQESSIIVEKKENQSQQYTGMGRFIVKSRILKRVDNLVPAVIKSVVKRAVTKAIPPMSEETAAELRSLFLDDQEKLQSVFGTSYLDDWSGKAIPVAIE